MPSGGMGGVGFVLGEDICAIDLKAVLGELRIELRVREVLPDLQILLLPGDEVHLERTRARSFGVFVGEV